MINVQKGGGVDQFAWFIIHAFFQTLKIIHWNSANVTIDCTHKWRNTSTSGLRCHVHLGQTSKVTAVDNGVCLSNPQPFRLIFHPPLAADLFRSGAAERAWLSLLPDKGSTVPSVLFRSSICPSVLWDHRNAMSPSHKKYSRSEEDAVLRVEGAARLMLHRQG